MNPTPVRLQLRRSKGFNLQALSQATNGLPAVNCARPGRWGNPFRVGETIEGADVTRSDAVGMFRIALAEGRLRFTVAEVRAQLREHNLACWCKPGETCHADALLTVLRWDGAGEAPRP